MILIRVLVFLSYPAPITLSVVSCVYVAGDVAMPVQSEVKMCLSHCLSTCVIELMYIVGSGYGLS